MIYPASSKQLTCRVLVYYICRIHIHFDAIERDQDKPQVANLDQQGMQGVVSLAERRIEYAYCVVSGKRISHLARWARWLKAR